MQTHYFTGRKVIHHIVFVTADPHDITVYEQAEQQFTITVLPIGLYARRRPEKPPTIELVIDKRAYVLTTGIGNAACLRLCPT